jgi:hypothetical protein
VKINTNPGTTRLDKIMKEIIWWTIALSSVPLILLGAALVPGDKIDVNTVGAVTLIVLTLALDAVIILPCLRWRRKINGPAAPVLAPVDRADRW